jgi:hypothetical protein
MIPYSLASTKYRPTTIQTLLIGEAPPPSGKFYFYVPKEMNLNLPIEYDTSLPATIFHHYFGARPATIPEYKSFLQKLKAHGIFLIDMIEGPLKIRRNMENESYLISRLPELAQRVREMGIDLPEEQWIFFMARTSYQKHIRENYPKVQRFMWIDFRLNPSPLEMQDSCF